MVPYSSQSGKTSGVIAYEIGNNFIKVKFTKSPRIYTYSHVKPGISQVTTMKSLAISQRGLSTYISRTKPTFETDLFD